MEMPPRYRNARRDRRQSHSKTRGSRLDKYNGIDISSTFYQRKAWDRLQKSISYFVAILNQNNISLIRAKLLRVNLVRGKGILCQAIMNAQSKYVDDTDVYADFISLINSDFPNIGELLLTRCIIQFKTAYDQSDKCLSRASVIFIAHLIKRYVASDILALDLLNLLSTPMTELSTYLICDILCICGNKVVNGENENAIISIFFKMIQYIFQRNIDEKFSDMIDMLFKVLEQFQKNFRVHETCIDLVRQNKQTTHLITLNSATDPQEDLNSYVRDIDYEANEMLHFQLVFQEILKYEVKYHYTSYNSDGDADNEEDSEEETTEDFFI